MTRTGDVSQPLRGGDAAESSAHDDDMRQAGRVGDDPFWLIADLQRIHFESALLVEAEHEQQ